MRFFAVDSEPYESARLQLNAAWGLPDGKGTVTCIEPASTAWRAASGRVLLAVASEWCEWEPAAGMIPEMLSAGVAAEIDEATFRSLLPQFPVP